MTRMLAAAVWDFAKQTRGRPTALQQLGWKRSRWQNFSKLKYWGLVTQLQPKSGEWLLTGSGLGFVTGQLAVPRAVWTWNDAVVELVQPEIKLGDVWSEMPAYHERGDFVQAARPHVLPSPGPEAQGQLF